MSIIHFQKRTWTLRGISGVLTALFLSWTLAPQQALAAPTPGTPTAVTVSNDYDGNGNLVRRVDGNGDVTTFEYDAVNRLIAIDYPGGESPDVTFTYDRNGNRTGITDGTGTTTYDYDFYDRLTGIDYPDGNFVLYGYDNVGNVSDLFYGNTLVLSLYGVYTYIHYEHDEDNRISSVENVFTDDTTAYTYDAAGNVTRRTLPNGAYTDYSYDTDGRLTNVVHRKSDNALICGYAYTLNAIGNRTQVIETLPSAPPKPTSYTYDALDRLDTVTYPDTRFVDYDYDSFGNRMSMTENVGDDTTVTAYTYDNDSRLLSTTTNGVPHEYFTYDTTGNLIQKVRPSDGRQIDYVYDYENRLVRFYDGSNNVEYLYNGVGERVAKLVNGERTQFINDPNRDYVQVLAETDDVGVAQRVYEWGNELINQEDISGDARHYYLHDAVNGSVRRLIDGGQAVVNSYDYDAFGEVTSETAGVPNDYQFHGEVQEGETELLFLRARLFDPATGRFLTRDPWSGWMEHPFSLNPYPFPSDDPINKRDPSGLYYPWLGVPIYFNGIEGIERGGSLVASGRLRPPGDSPDENKKLWEFNDLRDEVDVERINQLNRQNRQLQQMNQINQFSLGSPGGVALNASANVLLDINQIAGGTYDPDTGQIILYGTEDGSATALPPMELDDLAVAFRAVSQGTMPVVSIEDPIVSSPPAWPGRECFTGRYGPFDLETGEVMDVSSGTQFGWVMFEADRQMKCLGMGRDNRDQSPVNSSVPGFRDWFELAFLHWDGSGETETRFWFSPKEIEVAPSGDGQSMELKKAEMQLETECMMSSRGEMESTPAGEAFATQFTSNYDVLAEEQTVLDATNGVHYIFKELKQLAALVGVVKWIQDNDIPMDLSFLENYEPEYVDTSEHTPQITRTQSRTVGSWIRRVTIAGGVNYCNDLEITGGGDPEGLAAGALSARGGETDLAWTFSEGGSNYNATAFSVDKKEKDGGFSYTETDVELQVTGDIPLRLARHYDSFDVTRTDFGWGWKTEPYAVEFKGKPVKMNLCAMEQEGYGEMWFLDRQAEAAYRMVPSGYYDVEIDPYGLASTFETNEHDVIFYTYEGKETPGLLITDTVSNMVMRLADGRLIDFDPQGRIEAIQDRNGNSVDYEYDGNERLVSIGQDGGRTITFAYDGQERVTSATVPGGHTATYTYDGNGDLVSAQMDAPNGKLVQYSYDGRHNLVEVRDEDGNATESRAYDVYGRVTQTTQTNVVTPFAQDYSLAAKTSQITGPESFSQSYAFNADYDPVEITDARSNTTERTYNSYRDVKTERKPDGRAWTYYYDYRGNRIATVVPNERADVTILDRNRNPIYTFHSLINSNFNASFNAEHVLTSLDMNILPVGFSENEYDGNGNVTNSIDANGHTKRFAYDAQGQRNNAWDGRGHWTRYEYDSHGRLTRQWNELGQEVQYAYDELDNRTNLTTDAGSVAYEYNDKNQLTAVTKGDPGARHRTEYTYDAKGQIETVTDPDGVLTAYTYDDRGNLLGIEHDGVTRFTYEYDGLNRLTATHYTGTTGGGKAAVVPVSPVGTEELEGDILIAWEAHGDWTGNLNVTIQYSTDGAIWTDIATVNAADESYLWDTGNLVSETVQIRFVRTGDPDFLVVGTETFSVLNGGEYYVNDGATADDQYCNVAGQAYNGTTVTGLSPDDPADSLQDIIDHYPIQPGDKIYVDTGNYLIGDDIVITEDDAGYWFRPVTITGPTKGPGAVITHTNAAASDACIMVIDTDSSSGDNAEGIIVEYLKLTGARHGIQLFNALRCTVRNCECYANGLDGGAGEEGSGAGIRVSGEGLHVIENNVCHDNGANGGDGTGAGMDGGPGRGFGIIVESSYGNEVKENECYSNGGIGGGAGSGADQQGYSEGAGIFVQTVNPSAVAESNEITENECHDNDAHGRAESVTDADGGTGRSYGIALLETLDSNIERNQVWWNWGYGGRSWNGASGGKGGLGIGYGIYGQDEADLIVTKNVSYSNSGRGDYGGDDPDDDVGTGWAAGIYLKRCPNSIVKNNLCYLNRGKTYGTYGSEPEGGAYSSGIELEDSGSTPVVNNTLIQNHSEVTFWSSGTDRVNLLVSQVYLWGMSTNVTVKNNICEAAYQYSSGLWVEPQSTSGFVSDYNDVYIWGSAVAGHWGTTTCNGLSDWQTASGQDAHSFNSHPRYYDSGANDYHLAYDSPCVDSGEILATVQEDGDAEARPADGPDDDLVEAHDIGYDEFVDSDGDELADVTERDVTGTDPDEPDSDFDGLPDGWEVRYGLNPLADTGDNGAQGDPDGDDYTNIQEYLGGSDPTDPGSGPPEPPVITAFSPVAANVFMLEEQSQGFSIQAIDINGDPISYSCRLDGVEQATSNLWMFVTTDESSGETTLSKEYAVQLVATAGGDAVTQAWAVVVNNRNHAPVLETITNLSVEVGDVVQLNPVYWDPDNTNGVPGDDNLLTVMYSGWMTNSTKTVAAQDRGLHSVTVTVRDDGAPVLSDQQTIQVGVEVPNLIPRQPAGWSNTIIVSTNTGSHAEASEIRVGQTCYVDFAEGNDGSGEAGPSKMRLLIDGVAVETATRAIGLAPHGEFLREDVAHSFTTPGLHTLQVVVDVDGEVDESNETDNTYSRTVYVQPDWVLLYYLGNGNDSEMEGGSEAKFRAIASQAGLRDFHAYVLWDHFSGEDRLFHMKNDDDWNTGYTHEEDYWTATDIGLPATELDMGDVNTLNKFAEFVVNREGMNSQYALVMFNHGAGVHPTVLPLGGSGPAVIRTGICFDGGGSYLSVREIGEGCGHMRDVIGKKIGVLHLDACLMQMVEINYELRDACDFVVGSENEGWTVTSGVSWESAYLDDIAPGVSTEGLAVGIAEAYFAEMAAEGATISVLVPEKTTNIVDGLNALSDALVGCMPERREDIEDARDAAQKFAYYDDENTMTKANIFLDLGDFCRELQGHVGNESVSNAAAVVLTGIGVEGGAFVKYEAHQNEFGATPSSGYYFDAGTYGVSVFFPNSASPSGQGVYSNYTDQSSTPANLALCADGSWDRFLRAYLECGVLRVDCSGISSCTVTCSADRVGDGAGSTPFSRLYGTGESVTLSAPASGGGKTFYCWHVPGMSFPVGQRTVTFPAQEGVVSAEYRDVFTLDVQSDHGSPIPTVGLHTNFAQTVVSNFVGSPVSSGSTQFVCSGWVMTGHQPALGAANKFDMTVTNDAVLAWLWETNYWLELISGAHGSIDRPSDFVRGGSNVVVSAQAEPYYHFELWIGDTNAIVSGGPLNSNIVVTVGRPLSLTACFEANVATNQTPEWWLASHSLTNRDWDIEALDDQDKDGMLTWQEWAADTDPTCNTSLLRVTHIAWTNGGIHIEWQGGVEAWQFLQRCRDLTSSTEQWIVVFTNQPPTPLSTNYVDGAVMEPVQFYRIRAHRE